MKKTLVLFPLLLLIHPLNITKIWIDVDMKRAYLHFVICNIFTKDPQKNRLHSQTLHYWTFKEYS